MGINLQSIQLFNHDGLFISKTHIRCEIAPTVSDRLQYKFLSSWEPHWADNNSMSDPPVPEQFHYQVDNLTKRTTPGWLQNNSLSSWQPYYAGNDSRPDPLALKQFHCKVNSLTRLAMTTDQLQNNSTTVEPKLTSTRLAITIYQKGKNKSWCISNESWKQLNQGSIQRPKYHGSL